MFQKTIGEWDCIKTRGFFTECPSCQTLNSGIQFLESSSPVDIGKGVRLVMSPTGFLSTRNGTKRSLKSLLKKVF